MSQTCQLCGKELIARVATVEAPFVYAQSGLKDIFLTGIVVRECQQCKRELPIIPRIAELHQVIAADLAKKPALLRGDEIKFLRKHAGLPANKFARLIGVTPEYLSRVENEHHDALGSSADKLARFFAMAVAQDGEMARSVLLEMAESIGGPEPPSGGAARRHTFELVGKKRWRVAA